jgi:hypothetical protein
MLYDTRWDTKLIATDEFLSAPELGVPEKARAALITVLGMMERGEIKYADRGKHEYHSIEIPDHLIGMQMTRIWSQNECGTAGCLLGWARWVAKDYFLLPGEERSDELNNLFCMGGYSGRKSINRLIPADIAPALRSWLTTGKVAWPC